MVSLQQGSSKAQSVFRGLGFLVIGVPSRGDKILRGKKKKEGEWVSTY
jgi:hypothetical protein